jgi:hypothetical protein
LVECVGVVLESTWNGMGVWDLSDAFVIEI